MTYANFLHNFCNTIYTTSSNAFIDVKISSYMSLESCTEYNNQISFYQFCNIFHAVCNDFVDKKDDLKISLSSHLHILGHPIYDILNQL